MAKILILEPAAKYFLQVWTTYRWELAIKNSGFDLFLKIGTLFHKKDLSSKNLEDKREQLGQIGTFSDSYWVKNA